ncbi:hypothetical protein C2G38_2204979 [Gigaspora rosea]|uniref:SPRY domain-containing protein n=1 Tax=Gigaspora rosea TaxID=44941 RepID=A0A397UNY3_9GLOM|nr:hypothetical protein C2G38_2204979 [Gigaspora rosea]
MEFRVNYIGPNNYKIVALSEQIPSLNSFFYFEVEILNKGNDGSNTITNDIPEQDYNSWSYQDDGYFVSFKNKNCKPYGPSYTTGDTIGVACYIPKDLENSKTFLYPCELRSQGGSIEVNFGEYEKAFADLTKVLESEPENVIARRYRGEIDQIMDESYNDITELLKFNPNDFWAINVYELDLMSENFEIKNPLITKKLIRYIRNMLITKNISNKQS